MTEQERERLVRALNEQAERNKNPDEARRFLISTGTYTANGDLAPEFGGPGYDDIKD